MGNNLIGKIRDFDSRCNVGSNPTFPSIGRLSMKDSDLWEEFVVNVLHPELKIEVPICGLCGNLGIIDTTKTAFIFGISVGVKTYCICPNGRCMKE